MKSEAAVLLFLWHRIGVWFTGAWWRYLLARPRSWTAFWCRAIGHQGPVWYNPGGTEPNMHCVNCGDDLG
jgi:hypothetical protein